MTKKTTTMGQALKDSNSTNNQGIKGKFVDRHVYCNVNTMVEYIISKGYEDRDAPFSVDDVENYYTYPEFNGKHASFDGGSEDDRDAEVERMKDLLAEKEDSKFNLEYDNEKLTKKQQKLLEKLDSEITEIESEIADLKHLEIEAAEIYEWWAVSDFLFRKLKELNHPVLDAGSCLVWGRCTSGQAILLDYSISQICAGMEILEGQANAWKP